MTQPEALRLADALTEKEYPPRRAAAAELRRLHEAHDWQYKMAGERLRRIEKMEAVNQELLEALKDMLALWDEEYGFGIAEQARAAIARAEGDMK